jgi:serine protease AprX
MRRTAGVVAAVLLVAAVPLVAPDGLVRPHTDRTVPAPVRIAPAVLAAAASAMATGPDGTSDGAPESAQDATPRSPAPAPVPTLDLVLSLDRPADRHLRQQLDDLGTWSWAFSRVPVAAVRLPADLLADVEALDGVVAVHLNEPLPFLLQESALLVDAPRAWNDLGVTGKGVTVAVIDTGVDFTHPDLAPALKANVKLVGFGGPLPGVPVEAGPNSDTSTGHGTHVAGDVASRGTASGGAYRGLAPGAGLVGIGAGDGLTLNLYTVVQAYDWVIEQRERLGIRVVNNSFGAAFAPFDPTNPVNVATRAAADAGLVVVFANGNDGDEMSMNALASAPWVLGVGAATKAGGIARFSSAGIEADQADLRFDGSAADGETRSPLRMGFYHPAFLTPGEAVVSTRAPATITSALGFPADASLPPDQIPRYTTMSGTSMAAPEAAGVVALVLEADPALHPEEVRRVLQTTARPVPNEPFHRQGYGLLDAGAAVALALDLRSLPAAEVARRLEERQAARDAEVLANLAHPTRSASWSNTDPDDDGRVRHQVAVTPGTARIKMVTNGVSVPFLGLVQHALIVKDAAGTEVGRTTSAAASGTTVLDLDLLALEPDGAGHARPYDRLAFGTWTVEIAIGDEGPEQPFTFGEGATVVSTYPPVPAPACVTTLADAHPVSWLFQDDAATGVSPYAPDGEFTYVGPVRGGTLGNRAPERRLAGTFGGGAGALSGWPVFATAPLTEPLSLGGAATVQTWLQGPGEVATGLLRAELLDLAPDAGTVPKVVATSSGDDPGRAAVSAPQRTEVLVPVAGIVTIPAGHRLGVRLALAFAGTAADTLLYDSTRYPSGLSAVTGRPVEDCINPARSPLVIVPQG